MKLYHVDLRGLPASKANEIIEILEKFAFDCYPHLDTPGTYDVAWDSPEPIEKFIPSDCIQDP